MEAVVETTNVGSTHREWVAIERGQKTTQQVIADTATIKCGRLEITSDCPGKGRVYLDGKELKGVTEITVRLAVHEETTATISLITDLGVQ